MSGGPAIVGSSFCVGTWVWFNDTDARCAGGPKHSTGTPSGEHAKVC